MIPIIKQETIQFFIFIALGISFSFIFDFFRALRKGRKPSVFKVYLQDTIYFLLIGSILIYSMINYTADSFRLYFLIGIVLGITFYIGFFGNNIMMLFTRLINAWNEILSFVFLPLSVFNELFAKQIYILKKFVIKCCKKISYMVNSNYTNVKKWLFNKINKRGNVKNVKGCIKNIKKEI